MFLFNIDKLYNFGQYKLFDLLLALVMQIFSVNCTINTQKELHNHLCVIKVQFFLNLVC